MRELADVIGILYQDPEAFLKGNAGNDDEVAEIEALIKLRNDSRASKDWANADMARDKLTEMGIVLEDGPEGTNGVVSESFKRADDSALLFLIHQ